MRPAALRDRHAHFRHSAGQQYFDPMVTPGNKPRHEVIGSDKSSRKRTSKKSLVVVASSLDAI